METDSIFSIVTIIIAFSSLAIAYVTWLTKTKNERAEDNARDTRVITKLEFISDDVKDIKAEYRNFRDELTEVRGIATHASERAEAAHNRLDRIESGTEIIHMTKGEDRNE